MEADLAIPDGCKLAAQKAWRRTVFRGRPDGVDNPDASAGLERRDEVIEQAVRLCDFVVHVHQDRSVERMSRQPRIVRLTEADGDVLQSEMATHRYSGTTSCAMMRPWGPTIGARRTT